MGTVYSDQKTKWDQNNPTEAIKPIEMGGRVRVAYGSYTASAEQSDIHMFNLPNGARILSGELVHVALGSSTTASVGHAAYKNAAGLEAPFQWYTMTSELQDICKKTYDITMESDAVMFKVIEILKIIGVKNAREK